MIEMCKALQAMHVPASSCHFQERIFRFKPDICLHLSKLSPEEARMRRELFFREALAAYDVFHFHYGETFFPDRSDLPILKQRGKKMIMQHRGSDVRMLSVARSFNNPYVQIKRGESRKEAKIAAKLQELSSYIDEAIVADYELYEYVKPFYKKVHLVRQIVDLQKFTPAYPSPNKEVPLIIHAPTSMNVKGTDAVLRAVEQLSYRNIPFTFKLIEKLEHEQALQIYRKADIIIDQLLIGSFGIFSLEAMALGKPVICYIRAGLERKYPAGLPVVNANPQTIYDQLRNLIARPDLRHHLGKQGRRYVEQHYHSRLIAQKLAAIYRGL